MSNENIRRTLPGALMLVVTIAWLVLAIFIFVQGVHPPKTVPLILAGIAMFVLTGFLGSMVKAPIEYAPSFWNTGLQVIPALPVFHTPPEATPMYQVCLSSG